MLARSLSWVLGLILSLGWLCSACGEEPRERGILERAGEKLDRAAERLGDEFGRLVEESDAAIERARQRFGEQDDTLTHDIESALDRLGAELERGREKAGRKASDARDKLEREVEAHLAKAREGLDELRRASKGDWQRVLDDIQREAREAGESLRESAGK